VSRDIMEKARLGEVLDDIFVFDCHGHLGPSFVHHIPGHDASSMIQTMDHLGVDLLCLSGMASIGGDHRVGNDLVGEAIEMFPHRTLGYACINPHYGEEASEELHRCFDVLKCKAVKIHPMFHAHPANGPGYKPVWEFAARQGCPLLTHTLGGDPTCSPKMFDTLAREYPQVPILLGHAGNNLAGVAEAVKAPEERVSRPQLCDHPLRGGGIPGRPGGGGEAAFRFRCFVEFSLLLFGDDSFRQGKRRRQRKNSGSQRSQPFWYDV
jgi:predicted TIM-barrel fold metal-dependent hydrolase